MTNNMYMKDDRLVIEGVGTLKLENASRFVLRDKDGFAHYGISDTVQYLMGVTEIKAKYYDDSELVQYTILAATVQVLPMIYRDREMAAAVYPYIREMVRMCGRKLKKNFDDLFELIDVEHISFRIPAFLEGCLPSSGEVPEGWKEDEAFYVQSNYVMRGMLTRITNYERR